MIVLRVVSYTQIETLEHDLGHERFLWKEWFIGKLAQAFLYHQPNYLYSQ